MAYRPSCLKVDDRYKSILIPSVKMRVGAIEGKSRDGRIVRAQDVEGCGRRRHDGHTRRFVSIACVYHARRTVMTAAGPAGSYDKGRPRPERAFELVLGGYYVTMTWQKSILT